MILIATIAERIIILADSLGMNKSEFARVLKLTPAYISKLANNPTSVPSDRTIKDICREFKVNEQWLRTGEGEMFLPMDPDSEIAEFVGTVLSDAGPSFKKRLIKALADLPEEAWENIEAFARKLAEKNED